MLEYIIHKYAPYKLVIDSVMKTALNYEYILLNGTCCSIIFVA